MVPCPITRKLEVIDNGLRRDLEASQSRPKSPGNMKFTYSSPMPVVSLSPARLNIVQSVLITFNFRYEEVWKPPLIFEI